MQPARLECFDVVDDYIRKTRLYYFTKNQLVPTLLVQLLQNLHTLNQSQFQFLLCYSGMLSAVMVNFVN